eukprot:GHVH01007179.1.p1 GENE.GHVH01007179.1~~GHVH01007179.1.p1  ORF type:complete len:814 (-),score=102.28 GHVH01007179.1:817-3258(-)
MDIMTSGSSGGLLLSPLKISLPDVILIMEGRSLRVHKFPTLEVASEASCITLVNYPKEYYFLENLSIDKSIDPVGGGDLWTLGLVVILDQNSSIQIVEVVANELDSIMKIRLNFSFSLDLSLDFYRSIRVKKSYSETIQLVGYNKRGFTLIDISLSSQDVTKNEVIEIPIQFVNSFAANDSLTRLVCCDGVSGVPLLLNLTTKEKSDLPKARDTLVLPLFSPDRFEGGEKIIFSAKTRGNVVVYSLDATGPPSSLMWHAHPAMAKCFSPNHILTGGEEGVVVAWNLSVGSGSNRSTMPRVGGIMTDIVDGPQDGWILARRADNSIVVFNSNSRAEHRYVGCHVPIGFLQSIGFGDYQHPAGSHLPQHQGWEPVPRLPPTAQLEMVRPKLSATVLKEIGIESGCELLAGPFWPRQHKEAIDSKFVRCDVGDSPMLNLTDSTSGKVLLSEGLQRVTVDLVPRRFFGGNYERARPYRLHGAAFFKDSPWVLTWLSRERVVLIPGTNHYRDRFRLFSICPTSSLPFKPLTEGGSESLPLSLIPIDDFVDPHNDEIIHFNSFQYESLNRGKPVFQDAFITGDASNTVKIWKRLIGSDGASDSIIPSLVQQLDTEEKISDMFYLPNRSIFATVTLKGFVQLYDTSTNEWKPLIGLETGCRESYASKPTKTPTYKRAAPQFTRRRVFLEAVSDNNYRLFLVHKYEFQSICLTGSHRNLQVEGERRIVNVKNQRNCAIQSVTASIEGTYALTLNRPDKCHGLLLVKTTQNGFDLKEYRIEEPRQFPKRTREDAGILATCSMRKKKMMVLSGHMDLIALQPQ